MVSLRSLIYALPPLPQHHPCGIAQRRQHREGLWEEHELLRGDVGGSTKQVGFYFRLGIWKKWWGLSRTTTQGIFSSSRRSNFTSELWRCHLGNARPAGEWTKAKTYIALAAATIGCSVQRRPQKHKNSGIGRSLNSRLQEGEEIPEANQPTRKNWQRRRLQPRGKAKGMEKERTNKQTVLDLCRPRHSPTTSLLPRHWHRGLRRLRGPTMEKLRHMPRQVPVLRWRTPSWWRPLFEHIRIGTRCPRTCEI